MQATKREDIIVGRGRLGRSLAAALQAPSVAAREPSPALERALSEALDARVTLAVPDAALPALAARLAGLDLPGRPAFVHLSGALGLDALAPLRARGHAVGSLHPLQSFPRVRGPEAFHGVLFAIDASDAELLAALAEVGRRLGGAARRVDDSDRARYHAAATLIANGLVALADHACIVLGELGWSREEALDAVLPLLAGTVDNLREGRLPWALSGPVRRGDVDTVRRHLAALAPDPRQERLYRILGLAALDLAREAGLDPEAANHLHALLTG
jgi:predicted short-subunit dehydrogenase-like oxidoreductase (DUF2520 family)